MPENNKTLTNKEKVCRYIRENVISQNFRPGQRIRERELAERLGVSRTPVREAIQALRDDGWLTVEPRRGTTVLAPRRYDINEVMEIRILVGGGSVVTCAEKAGPNDVAYFYSLLARQERAAAAGDQYEFLRADMDMHLAFVQVTGNRRLYEFAKAMCDICHRVAQPGLKDGSRFPDVLAEHLAIVDAIAAGDGPLAKQKLTEHLEHTRVLLLEELVTGPETP